MTKSDKKSNVKCVEKSHILNSHKFPILIETSNITSGAEKSPNSPSIITDFKVLSNIISSKNELNELLESSIMGLELSSSFDDFFFKDSYLVKEVLEYVRLQKITKIKGRVFKQHKKYTLGDTLGIFLGATTNMFNGDQFLYFTIDNITVSVIPLFKMIYMDLDSIIEK